MCELWFLLTFFPRIGREYQTNVEYFDPTAGLSWPLTKGSVLYGGRGGGARGVGEIARKKAVESEENSNLALRAYEANLIVNESNLNFVFPRMPASGNVPQCRGGHRARNLSLIEKR